MNSGRKKHSRELAIAVETLTLIDVKRHLRQSLIFFAASLGEVLGRRPYWRYAMSHTHAREKSKLWKVSVRRGFRAVVRKCTDSQP